MKRCGTGAKILAITGFYTERTAATGKSLSVHHCRGAGHAQRSDSSTHAQMMLTDLLFMALVQQDLEHAPERIRHSEALVKTGLSKECAYNARPICDVLRVS